MQTQTATRDERAHEADGTGYQRVDTTISCLLTRFQLKSAWSLLGFYRTYRAVRRQAAGQRGLLATAFLIENLRTCYTLSFWQDGEAIAEFNTRVHAHISAANWSFGHLSLEARRPQLWSAQFRLSAISPHNMRWAPLAKDVIRRHIAANAESSDVA